MDVEKIILSEVTQTQKRQALHVLYQLRALASFFFSFVFNLEYRGTQESRIMLLGKRAEG